MATDKQIRDWLKANPNATDVDRRNAMEKHGVSTKDLARATGADQGAVNQRYNQAGIDRSKAYYGTDRGSGIIKERGGMIDTIEAGVRRMDAYAKKFEQDTGFSFDLATRKGSTKGRQDAVDAFNNWAENEYLNGDVGDFNSHHGFRYALANGRELRDVWDTTKDPLELYKAVDEIGWGKRNFNQAVGIGERANMANKRMELTDSYDGPASSWYGGDMQKWYEDAGYRGAMGFDPGSHSQYTTGVNYGKRTGANPYAPPPAEKLDGRATNNIFHNGDFGQTAFGGGQYGFGLNTPGSAANPKNQNAWGAQGPGFAGIDPRMLENNPLFTGEYNWDTALEAGNGPNGGKFATKEDWDRALNAGQSGLAQSIQQMIAQGMLPEWQIGLLAPYLQGL